MTPQSRMSLIVLAAVACGTGGPAVVRPGLDVVATDSLHLLEGVRVGLLTNQTGVGRDGTHAIERLARAGVQLEALFSPEHGFRGVSDDADIGHSVDSATGLPIYSLYGAVRAPTPEMLADIDRLLIDLQDIGSRTYTYISTALLAMRAAAASGVEVIVLDRPNPIGGELVQGPIITPDDTSFVGMLPVPLRHGLTFGELARLGNERLGIGASLTVIPAAGWRRDRWFDGTGLPWIRPSPNMPDLESATHYPGLVVFEATNVSVGRGTPLAFQVLGAPWLDAAAVIRRLGDQVGVVLRDTVVRPERPADGKHGGQSISAIRFEVSDRSRYDPVATAARVLEAIHDLHGERLALRPRRFAQLMGTGEPLEWLRAGRPLAPLMTRWGEAAARFAEERRPYLLYP